MKNYIVTLCLGMACAIAVAQSSEHNEYQIKILVGNQIEEIIPFWAHLRLVYFREYPYLYDGTLDAELAYCKEVMSYKDAAIAVAYCDEQPIGLLSGSSLVNFEDHFGNAEGFKTAHLDATTFYYFGEGIVLPDHRNKGLGTQLSKQLESWVITQGYTNGCFVSESHETHPLKPHNYKEHDSLWHALGYEKTDISVTFSWNTIQPDGSSRNQDHSMPYWIKLLTP